MTKTALENKRIASQEKIARERIAHEKAEGMKDRGVAVATAAIGGLSRVGAAGVKATPKGKSLTTTSGYSGHNDPAWYKQLPAGEKVATGIPTFFTTGQAITGVSANSQIPHSLPQMCVLYYHNTFGHVYNAAGQTQAASMLPINLAASRLMTIARSFNSRIGQYNPSDFLQFILAEVELIRLITRLKRALGAYHVFSSFAPSVREELINACGFDFSDFQQHLKEYEGWLIPTISFINENVVVPSEFPYLYRKLFLDSTIFKEGDGDNAQYVLMQPLEFFTYNENQARLAPTQSLANIQFAGFLNVYQQILNSIQNTSVYKELVADLRDAARNGLKLYEIPQYDRGVAVSLTPMKEVLWQVMNATLAPNFKFNNPGISYIDAIESYYTGFNMLTAVLDNSDGSCFKQYAQAMMHLNQDTNGFLIPCMSSTGTSGENFKAKITFNSSPKATQIAAINTYLDAKDNYLNFYKNDVDGDDIMEATRLTNTWHVYEELSGSNYDQWVEARNYSTEILICGLMSMGPRVGTGNVRETITFGMFRTYTSDSLFSFNYKPTRYDMVTAGGVPGGYLPIQQWDKVVALPQPNLYILHDVATKSLFTIAPNMSHK